MKKDGQKPIYPLDKELGIMAYQIYSAYFEFIVAKLGAKSFYRVTVPKYKAIYYFGHYKSRIIFHGVLTVTYRSTFFVVNFNSRSNTKKEKKQ